MATALVLQLGQQVLEVVGLGTCIQGIAHRARRHWRNGGAVAGSHILARGRAEPPFQHVAGCFPLQLPSPEVLREEHPQEWLFTALAYGRRDVVVKGDPDLNWNDAHPHYGTPLHAIGAGGNLLEVEGWPDYEWTEASNAYIKDLQSLFEFAMGRGADPAALCPCHCPGAVAFTISEAGTGKMIYQFNEPVGGRSAISLWLAFSQRAREWESNHPNQLPLASSFFDGIISLLLHVIPKYRGSVTKKRGLRHGGEPALALPAMEEVPEATTTLWAQVMSEGARDEGLGPGDVVFQCRGGDVRVHSCVASCASRVLSAMLQWPRKEDEVSPPWVVPLDDRREAVEAWRVLIYTGLPPQEGMSTDMLLDVLDLSHRWQDHLLKCGILVAALVKRIVDSRTCGLILDTALSKDLPELRGECLAFARQSKEVRRDWELGNFSEEASRQLGAIFEKVPRSERRSRSAASASGGANTGRRWELI